MIVPIPVPTSSHFFAFIYIYGFFETNYIQIYPSFINFNTTLPGKISVCINFSKFLKFFPVPEFCCFRVIFLPAGEKNDFRLCPIKWHQIWRKILFICRKHDRTLNLKEKCKQKIFNANDYEVLSDIYGG